MTDALKLADGRNLAAIAANDANDLVAPAPAGTTVRTGGSGGGGGGGGGAPFTGFNYTLSGLGYSYPVGTLFSVSSNDTFSSSYSDIGGPLVVGIVTASVDPSSFDPPTNDGSMTICLFGLVARSGIPGEVLYFDSINEQLSSSIPVAPKTPRPLAIQLTATQALFVGGASAWMPYLVQAQACVDSENTTLSILSAQASP